MPAKIFVSYRRDDDPAAAARVRDGLAARFGKNNLFMDVDNLFAGLRFDEELTKALSACDVFIAIIGARWMGLLKDRPGSGERDYVREEITAALGRKIVVIPVRVGRDGQLAPLPRVSDLEAAGIADLVHYQKHDVTHENFGRDIGALADAIIAVRRRSRAISERSTARGSRLLFGTSIGLALAAVYVGARFVGMPVPWLDTVSFGPAGNARGDAPHQPAPIAERPRLALVDTKRPADEAGRERSSAEPKRDGEANAARRDMAHSVVAGSGESFRDKLSDGQPCPTCPEMVVVPEGSFTMGSTENDDEKPPHRVILGQPFAVAKFEVTFDEWTACVTGGGCAANKDPGDQGWGRGRRPVINVSWGDAKEFVAWLSKKTQRSYRLLTEAEWEYAARAGTTTRYFWGDEFSNAQANNSKGRSVDVGQYASNAWGLHDMHGNVWEWVEDCWHNNYSGAPKDARAWTSSCADNSRRVIRGGSWSRYPRLLRSAGRNADTADIRYDSLGFRVGRTLDR